MTRWDRRLSTFVNTLSTSNDAFQSIPGRMTQAIEEFIENYLLTRGYPLTDANRECARKILGQHPEPNPDLIGSSAQERIAMLDRNMRGWSW
jgi:hypothetical protein